MIYGIGTDIVDNKRIKHAVEKWGEKFLGRIFSEKERLYCMTKQNPYPSLSARFAAKEAFIKAFSPAVISSLKDIEVVNADCGKPYIRLHGTTGKAAEDRNIGTIHLSISHETDFSIAYVLIEGAE